MAKVLPRKKNDSVVSEQRSGNCFECRLPRKIQMTLEFHADCRVKLSQARANWIFCSQSMRIRKFMHDSWCSALNCLVANGHVIELADNAKRRLFSPFTECHDSWKTAIPTNNAAEWPNCDFLSNKRINTGHQRIIAIVIHEDSMIFSKYLYNLASYACRSVCIRTMFRQIISRANWCTIRHFGSLDQFLCDGNTNWTDQKAAIQLQEFAAFQHRIGQ